MKIGFCSIFINFRVGGEVEAAANAGGCGAAVYDNAADPLGHLNPHGQVWVPETCPIDPNIQTAYNLPCRLNWTILGEAHDLDRAFCHFATYETMGWDRADSRWGLGVRECENIDRFAQNQWLVRFVDGEDGSHQVPNEVYGGVVQAARSQSRCSTRSSRVSDIYVHD